MAADVRYNVSEKISRQYRGSYGQVLQTKLSLEHSQDTGALRGRVLHQTMPMPQLST